MNRPYLSVIVPVHNEERRLPRCLDELTRWLWARNYLYEIIVVSNGSTDGTARICAEHAQIFSHFKWFDYPERGKGLAVRRGMLAARGMYRLMMDVDLSTPLDEITPALRLALTHDVVIGSREAEPHKVKTTIQRYVIGRAFHALVQDLAPGIRDTQCGFKLFHHEAASRIFSLAQINGMAFDVEALFLARLLGYDVHEMPVTWTHDADSRVRLVGDSLGMLWDVLNIPTLHARVVDRSPQISHRQN